jgi:ATP synthase subunit 6
LININSLIPQSFAYTTQPIMTLTLGLIFWLMRIILGILKNTKKTITHITPQGTPNRLINFIVLVETIRILIRPITLRVRLIANITAGHLLISLLRNFLLSINYTTLIIISFSPIILTILESAVAFIQAYVFITLRVLYGSENQYAKKISFIPHNRKKTLTIDSVNCSLINNNKSSMMI